MAFAFPLLLSANVCFLNECIQLEYAIRSHRNLGAIVTFLRLEDGQIVEGASGLPTFIYNTTPKGELPLVRVNYGLVFRNQADPFIKKLPSGDRLTYLAINSNVVSDFTCRDLTHIKNLKFLDLSQNGRFSSGNRAFFSSFGKLEALWMRHTGITDREIEALNHLEKLRLLDVSSTRVTGKNFSKLKLLRSLSTLMLSSETTDHGVKEVASSFPNLESISIDGRSVTDLGLLALSPLKKLKKISIHDTSVTGAGFYSLATHRNLEFVDLSLSNVSDNIVDVLVRLPKLRYICLSSSKKVTGVGFDRLRICKDLEALSLEFTGVNDTGMRDLAKIESLKYLNVLGCRLSANAVNEIVKAKNLIELDISGMPIDDACLDLLATLPMLREVGLGNTNASKEGIRQFYEAIRSRKGK